MYTVTDCQLTSTQIDFQSSAEMHRTVINAGVDLDLDEMKRSYDGLEDFLNHTSHEIAASVPKVYKLDLNVIFFPQIGFLITIENNPVTGRGDYEGGETEDQRWDRIFSTRDRIYYKDARMRALDAEIGDMYALICGMGFRFLLSSNMAEVIFCRQGDRHCPRIRTASARARNNAECCFRSLRRAGLVRFGADLIPARLTNPAFSPLHRVRRRTSSVGHVSQTKTSSTLRLAGRFSPRF